MGSISKNAVVNKLVHMKQLCADLVNEIDDLVLDYEKNYNFEEVSDSVYNSMRSITDTIDLKDVANEIEKTSSNLKDDLVINLASNSINKSIDELNEKATIIEAADMSKLVTESEEETKIVSDAYNNIMSFDLRTEDEKNSEIMAEAAMQTKYVTEDEKNSDELKKAAEMINFDETISKED